ncbi:hypothetical protein, partial [Flavonifractor sp. An82]|uniref:hypothetical protein n=1 Tax=Flavonifractor sp. An82 TaxID=1965660 RepID=UPI001951076E
RPRPPCTISAEAVHHSSGGDAPSSAVKLHFLSGVRRKEIEKTLDKALYTLENSVIRNGEQLSLK